MELFIKICGLTRLEDAQFAEGEGADAAGFVAYPGSPRFISPEKAAEICAGLGGKIRRVGVFVNAAPDSIARYLDAGIQIVQLHGDENAEFPGRLPARTEVWRAIRPAGENGIAPYRGYPADKFVIDSSCQGKYGGTGFPADWKAAKFAVEILGRPVLLAGGIGPGNIAEAYDAVRPAGFDVGSAVESSPGRKDHRLVSELFRAVRALRGRS